MAKTTTPVKDGASPSVDDLALQIEVLKNDLSTLTSTLGDLAAAQSADAIETARRKAAALQAAGRDKATEAQLRAEEFIQTQPATSLGLAAGLGFLVGLITARR